MRVLIVLAHPEPRSFNAELAHTAAAMLRQRGHEVVLSDLYRSGFDPVESDRHYSPRVRGDFFDVQAEQRYAAESGTLPSEVACEVARVEAADLIIFQFPIWWFSPPAMMKGWVERVLVYGRTYSSALRYDRGRLGGRRAMVSVTTGGAESTFAPNGRNGDIDLILWPFQMSLHYVGLQVLPPFTAFGIDEDPISRNSWKQRFIDHVVGFETMAPIPFNSWGDWDDAGQLRPGAPSYNLFMRPA